MIGRLGRLLLAALLAAGVAVGTPAPRAAAQNRLDPAAVLGAIERGVAFLKKEQNAQGRWGDGVGYDGGVTALCTLALLNAGVEISDPTIVRALDFLDRRELEKTYTVSLQTMVLATADPNRYRLRIDKNVKWLERNQVRNGRRSGAWSYPGPGGDPSNSQFAVLALYEAQRVGAKVSPETWRLASRYWRGIQNANGSWAYAGDASTGSMTCAGIGALAIIQKAIGEGDARVEGGRVKCCARQQEDDAIERGVAWLGRNFSVRRNPGRAPGAQIWHYYYLYGLERAGRLSARRFFGDHDWYREGTEYLVNAQDGLLNSWEGAEGNRQISTAMALLFLSKGRRPLLVGKLVHGEQNGWNAHRHDADHLTRRTEEAWDLDLTWQTIDPAGATVEDLLQTPVLYVSGSKQTDLAARAGLLRDYVDRGGFIFAEGCCGDSRAFRESVEALVVAMFPEPEYRLRQLRPAHPIWRMERLVSPGSEYVGALWAVEYGCRTCLVFCDRDLSCYWELDNPQRAAKYPPAVEGRIDDALAIGLNVLAYATNREPLGKEQAFADQGEEVRLERAGLRGVIQVAKLRHGGGCDDAPGALANLARVAARGDAAMQIAETPELIGIGDAAFFRHHLSFMHGRNDFRLSALERGRLRRYLVENDGLLLADAICASPAFTKAFRRELLAALETYKIEQIPEGDPLFTPEYGGYDIRQVEVRDPQPAADDQPLQARTRRVAPQLEGVKINGRWRVIFSPLDLSCALERHEAVECRGYSREDAARIGLNVLLYSLNQ
ncbi:MAG: DUF4159 domain-containing protein [Planctomycetota bacterium]